jgi:hypothetical protein
MQPMMRGRGAPSIHTATPTDAAAASMGTFVGVALCLCRGVSLCGVLCCVEL